MGTVAGNLGACCTCEEFTSSGCDCGGGLPCGLECQSKSGIDAQLCGFSEFTDPSDPTKFYRRADASGSSESKVMPNSDCSGVWTGTGTRCTIGGSCTYDKDTCEQTRSGTQICISLVDESVILNLTGLCIDNIGGACGVDVSSTKTVQSASISDSPCCPDNLLTTEESYVVELSDEDTEEDAEKRAAAEIPDWTSCGSCAGCSAFRTDRTGTGLSYFGFRKVQVRSTFSATVGHTYNVKIYFSRRLLGSLGPFLPLGQIAETTLVADTISEHTDWFDVPTESGFETIASSCVVIDQG